MPELPEVEVVRRGLADELTGRTIVACELIGRHAVRAVRRHTAGPDDFVSAITGRAVIAVRRRGKYLWCVLDDGAALVAHLGMSGQFRVGAPRGDDEHDAGYDAAHADTPPHPHARIRLRLDNATVVDFVDQRTFGGLMVAAASRMVPAAGEMAGIPAPIAHIARDPLDPLFDFGSVTTAVRGKRSGIKRVLLDQAVVSGIGNIYADEALWAARVRYDRAASSLAPRTVRRVLDEASGVMTRALMAGGTSFDELYVNVNGRSGYFERSLAVYGRAGEPCRRCGATIRREQWTNRSSFYCPRCQRPARRA